MPKGYRIDHTGQRFGKLTALRRAQKQSHWDCLCDCGAEVVARGTLLRSGSARSCGCDRVSHGMTGTPEFRAWENARSRCNNPNNRKYPIYGGRGIRMAPEWEHDFGAFYAELGPRPSPNHSLDRIDSNGDYAPGNCRWATIEEQNNNRSCTRWVEADGVAMPLGEAARQRGIPSDVFRGRLNRGRVPGVRLIPTPLHHDDIISMREIGNG